MRGIVSGESVPLTRNITINTLYNESGSENKKCEITF